MNIILPFTDADEELAMFLLETIDKCQKPEHTELRTYRTGEIPEEDWLFEPIAMGAHATFFTEKTPEYPQDVNRVFQEAISTHIGADPDGEVEGPLKDSAFLFLEPDCIVTNDQIFMALDAFSVMMRKAEFGVATRLHFNSMLGLHINGVALYVPDHIVGMDLKQLKHKAWSMWPMPFDITMRTPLLNSLYPMDAIYTVPDNEIPDAPFKSFVDTKGIGIYHGIKDIEIAKAKQAEALGW